MNNRIVTAVAAAAVLTLPTALRQPMSAAVWLAAIGVMTYAHFNDLRSVSAVAVPVAGVLWLQVALFPIPNGQWMFGLVLGAATSLVVLGMALVYRANRVLNFAQSELGSGPAVFAVGLATLGGWSWFASVGAGLVAAVGLGFLVELVIIRRFTKAPRLILTVATIGLSQLLTLVSILIPHIWGSDTIDKSLDIPWKIRISEGPPALTGDHVLVLLAVPLVIAGLTAFIRFTDVGVAIRAAAESNDRAALLGVPVRRLQTTVWVLATVLSFTGIILRAGIVSLPVAAQMSFGVLLLALAAMVLGNLTDLTAVAASAVVLGVLEQAVVYNSTEEMVAPVMGAVIVVVMLIRKVGSSRADSDLTSSWASAEEVRPIPPELRLLPEVRLAKIAGAALGALIILWVGFAGAPSTLQKASLLSCFVLVAVSIVVLTGWAGQVSLGQMSLVAVGGVVGALAADRWHLDLSLALLLAAVAGSAVAVLLGLPALRLKGPFLGVTTLAFAVASTQFLLNRTHNSLLPKEIFDRPKLFAAIDMSDPRNFYFVTIAVTIIGIGITRRLRHSRTGRVLLALRDNEASASAYGVNIARAKLGAFAISGALAGLAGCLYVQSLLRYSEQPFEPAASFNVFTAAVVGGLGSITGAFIGALVLNGATWFLPANLQLLPSAFGVLIVLMLLPGGLGQLFFNSRDKVLRKIAERRGIVVPSLLADLKVEEEEAANNLHLHLDLADSSDSDSGSDDLSEVPV